MRAPIVPTKDPLNYGVGSPNYGLHRDGHGWGVMGIDDDNHSTDPTSPKYLAGNWKSDPLDNIRAGADILKALIASYSNETDAVHSYNAGAPENGSNPPNYADIVAANKARLNQNQFFICSPS